MHIAITYDLREERLAQGWSEQQVAEFDRADTIDALEAALEALGHEVERVGHVHALLSRLADGGRWDLVFNIAESFGGPGREALVPALLDSYSIPYTFADPLVCAVTLDKPTAKRLLRCHGIPTPDFVVMQSGADLDLIESASVSTCGVFAPLTFPVFAKLAREGSSMGVAADSVARTPDELSRVVRRLLREFNQPVLIERFLPGAEVTVSLLGTAESAQPIGVLEVVLKPNADVGVYTYDNKERCEELVEYRLVEGDGAERAKELAIHAFRAIGCRDAGRVDLRQDESGDWQVIEINALPGLNPSHSDLPITATLAGWSYQHVITRILDSAFERTHGSESHAAQRTTVARMRSGDLSVRESRVQGSWHNAQGGANEFSGDGAMNESKGMRASRPSG